jgi:hypothetical protein
MAEEAAPPAYLAEFTPADFQGAADVVLQLRGGAQLPAHSQLLASTSSLLCDLLKIAASQAPAGSKSVLQLEDFSEQEALDVLKARAGEAPAWTLCGSGQRREVYRLPLLLPAPG